MTATADDLLEWTTARHLRYSSDAADFVNHRVMIGGLISVEFRDTRPLLVVEWGDGCRADFPRGVAARALTYFLAGLLPESTARGEDCADEKGARSVQGTAPDGTACDVGPVHSPAAAERLRAEMDAAGWAPGRIVRHYSAGAFRAEASGEAAGS